MHSAFGYMGQKCSACSRVIVLDAVMMPFANGSSRQRGACRSDPPSCPARRSARSSTRPRSTKCGGTLTWRTAEGRTLLAVDVGPLAEEGYFVGPHIFANVKPSCRIAQEEIFGPVLGIIRAANFHDAIDIATARLRADRWCVSTFAGASRASPARVAGGELVSQSRHHRRARRSSAVRGFRMSGIGSKAGGRIICCSSWCRRRLRRTRCGEGSCRGSENNRSIDNVFVCHATSAWACLDSPLVKPFGSITSLASHCESIECWVVAL